jgi:hypothetical protein
MTPDEIAASFRPQINNIFCPCNLFFYILLEGGSRNSNLSEVCQDLQAVLGLERGLEVFTSIVTDGTLEKFSWLRPKSMIPYFDTRTIESDPNVYRISSLELTLENYYLVDFINTIPRFKRKE